MGRDAAVEGPPACSDPQRAMRARIRQGRAADEQVVWVAGIGLSGSPTFVISEVLTGL